MSRSFSYHWAMNNNDVLRRLRFTFDYPDSKVVEIFGMGDMTIEESQVALWLLKDDDTAQTKLKDVELASFLNGMIVLNRGKKEGVTMIAERQLNNNLIFRKLRIALNMKDTDILSVYDEVDMNISKGELSAIFRNPKQSQYRACQDQFLRNFLLGLQYRHRGRDGAGGAKSEEE